MDFQLTCACGATRTVNEGSAGVELECSCGRHIKVPPLHELRKQAGLTPHDVSPELIIEAGLVDGSILPNRECASCGVDTVAMVRVRIECERAIRKGGMTWGTTLLGLFFLPLALYRYEREKEYGDNKLYTVPLMICPQCRPTLRGTRRVRECLRNVPVYKRLLDKFPKSKITLVGD